MKPRILRGIAVLATALVAGAAAAQPYPSKTIRFIVPFSAGGATDLIARAVGQKLTESTGAQVVVENRPGASGMIGADIVAKSPADGYTLLMASVAEIAINPSVYAKMAYDPAKDLAPVTLAGVTPLILVVNPGSSLNSVKDIVAQAKAKPNSISFASAGGGSPQHLSGELLKTLTSTSSCGVEHVLESGGGIACAAPLSEIPNSFSAGSR